MSVVKRAAFAVLRTLGPLNSNRSFRHAVEASEMFLSSVSGRGSGSGWDQNGEINALLSKIAHRKNLVIFDVGANNGAWISCLYEKISHLDPICYLFECAPYCFPPISERTKNMNMATIVKKAVSLESGVQVFHLPEVGSGLGSLHERRDTSVVHHSYNLIEVDTVSIDDFVLENKIDKVDVIKMDIEGNELSALNGAVRCLRNDIISVIQFEFGSANVNSRTFMRDFWDFLSEFGFELFMITPGGYAAPIEKYDDSLEYFRGATNYIAKKVTNDN